MTEENFEAVIDEQLKYCKNLLIRKGKEYDQETEDRLRSFKVAAGAQKRVLLEAREGVNYDQVKGNEKEVRDVTISAC